MPRFEHIWFVSPGQELPANMRVFRIVKLLLVSVEEKRREVELGKKSSS